MKIADGRAEGATEDEGDADIAGELASAVFDKNDDHEVILARKCPGPLSLNRLFEQSPLKALMISLLFLRLFFLGH